MKLKHDTETNTASWAATTGQKQFVILMGSGGLQMKAKVLTVVGEVYLVASSQSNRLELESPFSSWSLQNCTMAWKRSPTRQDFWVTNCTTSRNCKKPYTT